MHAVVAGLFEELDRLLCRERGAAAAHYAQRRSRVRERDRWRAVEAEHYPATRLESAQRDRYALLELGLADEERRNPRAVVDVDVVERGQLLISERDAVVEAGAAHVRARPSKRRLPRIDADDCRVGPHVRGCDREQTHAGTHVEERAHLLQVGMRGGDHRGDHRGTATPAVEDRGIGECPAGGAARVVHEVDRLMDEEAHHAKHRGALRRGKLGEIRQPGRAGDGPQRVDDLGRRVDLGLQQRELGPERGERLGGGRPLHHRAHDLFERRHRVFSVRRSVLR